MSWQTGNPVFGLAALTLFTAPACATQISLVGSLDPNDANSVFLYSFTLNAASSLTIQSYGYGGSVNASGGTNAAGTVIPAGAFDTYISLFAGAGNGAAFLVSNDDGNCPPGNALPACHDSTLQVAALAGSYVLALSVFDNFSFAENFGAGTLGNGFIGLGDYFDAASGVIRSPNFAVDISGAGLAPPSQTPEPASWAMAAAALLFVLVPKRRAPNN